MDNYQENNEIKGMDPGQRQSAKKVMNLIVGLELLSIGTAFHDFQSSGSFLSPDDHSGKIEKEYTLDLLFGDIFYSRAVIYLLRFEDHDVFDRILASLKKLHESRLVLHREIGDLLQAGGDPSSFGHYVDTGLLTYDELIKYTLSLKTGPSTEKISSYLTSKKNFTDRKLSDIISELDSGKFKSSIKALLESLDN